MAAFAAIWIRAALLSATAGGFSGRRPTRALLAAGAALPLLYLTARLLISPGTPCGWIVRLWCGSWALLCLYWCHRGGDPLGDASLPPGSARTYKRQRLLVGASIAFLIVSGTIVDSRPAVARNLIAYAAAVIGDGEAGSNTASAAASAGPAVEITVSKIAVRRKRSGLPLLIFGGVGLVVLGVIASEIINQTKRSRPRKLHKASM